MSGINKAIIVGNLGADPDVRYTQSNIAVANMSIATSQRYKDKSGEWKDKTEWHRVVAWDKTAENCEKYLSKGSKVYVEGPIESREWEDKDGIKRYTTEIRALTVQFLDRKGEGGGGNQPPHPSENNNAGASEKMDSSVDLNEDFDNIDDDLPF